MQTRSDIIDEFLARSGWQGARRMLLAGDASFRKYERVFLKEKRAVLMDAPPEKEDIRPFVRVGEYLAGLGLSAPGIYAQDGQNGLLLLEDLGDDLFARVLERSPQGEGELYQAAADVLVHLHQHGSQASQPDIPAYDMPRFMSQVAVFTEWFLPLVKGPQNAKALEKSYLELWRGILQQLPDMGRVPVLYDFHAENILWLPTRNGVSRAGLLDFQDAMMGSPAYDMVSLLEDARRDVSPQTVEEAIAHYLRQTGLAAEEFRTAYALLGAQRNCRIVGTFARLALRDGKYPYLAHLPRVWQHLEKDLRHPLLKDLRRWMDGAVPAEWRGAIDANALKAQVRA